ncbi:hypothetical protein L9F63_002227, partial [Diploptera punctata]
DFRAVGRGLEAYSKESKPLRNVTILLICTAGDLNSAWRRTCHFARLERILPKLLPIPDMETTSGQKLTEFCNDIGGSYRIFLEVLY